VALIVAGVLDELTATGAGVGFLQTRRNVLTRGIDVIQLVGRTFRIGDVLCAGRPAPVLRVDVLSDGDIRAGSAIRST
jgi:DNA-binding MltR family transcriptional regulator